MKPGKIYFIESHRVNPESLDSRTCQILSSADVVLHDASSPAEVLALTRPSARHHNLGVAGSPSAMTPQEIRARLVTYATQGFTVVRLTAAVNNRKDETDVLCACGIDFDILADEASTGAENHVVAATA
jgi:siroheme synthase